jgi:pimeloyl-ACP methyl ester carboxylesterase
LRTKRIFRNLIIPFLAISAIMMMGFLIPLLTGKLNRHAELPISTVRDALEEKVYRNTDVKEIIIPGHGRIVYEVGGRGRPVLLIHCWSGSKEYWKYTMRDLSNDFRLYALDLKGFGESEKPRDGYRISDYADLIWKFCRAVGIERAHVVGHSLGGLIAARFAAERPDMVDRLVLVSTPLKGLPFSLRMIGYPLIGGLWYRMVRAIGGFALRGSVARKIWLKPTVRSATRSMRWFAKARLIDDLPRIRSPILLILGLKDRIVPPASARGFSGTSSGLNVAIIPDSKHSPMCENPAVFNEVLLSFLRWPSF